MRSRISLFALLFIVGSLALPAAAHASIPFFGPIIPSAYNVCPASWGLLITVINNIIELLITLAIVLVAPLTIAYAGFLLVIEPVSPGGISKARGIIWNTVIGIVIALSAWLIVDAVMAVLYHPTDPALAGKTWSQIITSGGIDPCIKQAGSLPTDTLNQAQMTGVSATGTIGSPPSGKAGTACDPSVVQAAAATGGYTLSSMQANIFACIAAPESNCGAPQNPPNYNWNSKRSSPGSTAAGAFQVLLSSNHSCYENSACYSAAGVSGSLNCQNGFDSRGNPKTDSVGAAVVQRCVTAASNLNCSASAAACLLQKNNGSFSPWQSDVNSQKQTGCITSGA